MKIYVGHSKQLDYKTKLYEPIRKSHLSSEHEIILPHEKSDKPTNSIDFLKTCDVMIAEVTYPATGLGIELGWANSINCPIICICQKGSKISSSVKTLTNIILEYGDEEEMVVLLDKTLKNINRGEK